MTHTSRSPIAGFASEGRTGQHVEVEHDTSEIIRCAGCKQVYLVSDLSFPEPDDDTNTKFGWLVASCPDCSADIQVLYDRVVAALTSED